MTVAHKFIYRLIMHSLFAAAVAAADETRVDDYRIVVDRSLERLAVEARFAESTTRVRATSRRAGRYLIGASDCDSGDRISHSGRRLELPVDGIHCLAYEVDLERVAADERRNRGTGETTVIASPSGWLWRPDLGDGRSIRARFDLPSGMRVAVPWSPVPGARDSYSLHTSPESARALAVFGDFAYHEVELDDATLRVAFPGPATASAERTLLRWLEATARDVSLAYGRFPNPSPLVLVFAVPDERARRSPVPFGRVVRNGGEAVELFADPTQPLDAFLDDWTATHEFSHLMLPYLDREARWLSEGFAQYYQNVLLARSGAYDPARAWQKIHAGLERGRASLPGVSPNRAARERSRGGRMKVYWTGAALALMADVELRRQSAGRESLDRVLDGLQACCLPSEHAWRGRDFMKKLDSLHGGEPVFVPLYDTYADAPSFPDITETFEALGIRAEGDSVALVADAPLAAHREQITGRDAETAAWRRDLAAD